ncbi:MFS transporter [Halobaculum sp. MBLA0147]|uniref:MFS transporter n=1 Tax=Halobaculum sp. MBLA0147 TaxID=3079934 RepID=UPI00352541EA
MSLLRSNREFRRLFVGRLTTNAGDSLYAIAAMWLVWELTRDPLFTGVAAFLTQAPSALGFLVGPLVDRWDLRRVLVVVQAVQAVLVLAVPLASLTGTLSVWVVLLVMPVLAAVDQFTGPAQTAALPLVVDDDRLTRANSLFATTAGAANGVFNALSGVLVALTGAVALYALDAVTFGVAALLFLGLRLDGDEETAETEVDGRSAESDVAEGSTDTDVDADESGPDETTGAAEADGFDWAGYADELRSGAQYLRGSVLVPVVVGALVVNFTSAATMAVLPAFAAEFSGAQSYGFLMAAFAVGNLAGTAAAGVLPDRPFGELAVVCPLVTGVGFVAVAFVDWFPAVLALVVVALVPMGLFNVTFQSLVQSVVADDLLGRVSSLLKSGTSVAMPIGSVVGGAAAGVVGVRGLILGQAVAIATLGLAFAVSGRLRSIPTVADADPSALGLGADPDRADATSVSASPGEGHTDDAGHEPDDDALGPRTDATE